MKWIKVSESLPKVGKDGYSEPVLVYFGKRCLPELAQYSRDNVTLIRGTNNKRGAQTHWWSTASCSEEEDRNGPTLHPTHWCNISFPKDE